ncbi:MAG: CD225/dispanin family protein [Bacteroidales bacterium]|nr:CD225/dispanin family protein [Bacteroidales bacterium]
MENQYLENNERTYNDMQRPNDLLVWSILSTIFCCLVTGIVAIVYSSKVNNLWDSGEHAEAIEAARKAKIWNIVGLVIGLVCLVIWIVYFVVVLSVINANGGWENFADMMSQMEQQYDF